mgnify:FL=1
MAAYPFFLALSRITDANGAPVTATLKVYDADTTDLASIYSDQALSTPLSNPLTSSSAGRFPPIFLDTGSYKIRVEDSLGNLLYDEFNDFDVPEYDPATNLQLVPETVTSNLSVDADDRGKIFQVDASGAPGTEVTITADFDDLGAGFAFGVINTGASGTVVIQGSGSETINGNSDYTLSNQNAGIGIVSLGSAGGRVIWNTGGIFTGDLNFTGDVDIDGDLNVDGETTFDKAITEASQTLTDQANIAWDMSAAPNAVVTLGDNRTLDAPTGEVAGMRGYLRVIQDGTGGRTLTWASAYKFSGGNDEKPGTAAAEQTLYAYVVRASDEILIRKVWSSGRYRVGFWREFDKSTFATSTTYTQAHGLGRHPGNVMAWIECTSTELGFSVGDRIPIMGAIGDGGGAARMAMVVTNTTNVLVVTGSSVPSITNISTNASGTITAANWKVIIRIYE